MSHTNKIFTVAIATTLVFTSHVFAGDSPSEINQRIGIGDPVAGKDKSAMCQGCHGEDGNSIIGLFPKLSGQYADYIQKQFREFQNGARNDATMADMALSVGEFPELFDIAAYFASQKLMKGVVIEDEYQKMMYRKGEKLYIEGNADSAAFRCIKCHGDHGMGVPLNNPLFPILGGQHKDYLIKQLKDFKTTARDNDRSGMMMLIAGRLTDDEIEALSTYLASILGDPPPPPPPPPPAELWQIVEEDKPMLIEGTNFDVGSAKLKKAAQKQLNTIVALAKKRPEAKFEIFGYTDSTGSDQLNQKLSLARAELVKKYLVKKGVAADRILTQGMGPANPIADNSTKEGRSKNRRVEVHTVLKEAKKVRVTE